MPLVTVGLPFYNNRRTIEAAVRSVFAQTHADWKLLLVDDGSSDGSNELVGAIHDPRVEVLSDGCNSGLVYRLNQIANRADTTLLARMDADDIMHPERLKFQARYLADHPGTHIVGTSAYVIDEAEGFRGVRTPPIPVAGPLAALLSTVFIHPSVCGRTEWFRRFPYHADFVRAEGRELWCRMSRYGGLANVADRLLFYRDPKRGSVRKYVASCETAVQIYKAHGPDLVGCAATKALMMASCLKAAAYKIAASAGLEGWMTARRNTAMSPSEHAEAREAMFKATSAAVPGWEVT